MRSPEVAEFQREAVYLTLTSNIALAAISEASLRGQIAATQRIIGLQTNLLGILRKQSDAGQIALPDVAATGDGARTGAASVADARKAAIPAASPAVGSDRTLPERRRGLDLRTRIRCTLAASHSGHVCRRA